MEKNYLFPDFIRPLKKNLLAVLTAGVLSQTGYGQTYTFTPCGATGSLGPSQGQATGFYSTSNLAGLVTISGQGTQAWTVPSSGMYRIEAYGAEGGNSNGQGPCVTGVLPGSPGGLGAVIKGDVNLIAGTVLNIVVGQKGGSTGYSGGGGGGSYVVTAAGIPLCIAGGGGGAAGEIGNARGSFAGGPGLIVTTGGNSNATGGGTYGMPALGSGGGLPTLGGNSGYGGGSGVAAGGGGLLSDGANGGTPPANYYDYGGKAFVNGSAGGIGTNACNWGGFGGGGGSQAGTGYGGGGGGYSGGGGGGLEVSINTQGSGGGGASFNSGINQSNTPGINVGDGKVIFVKLCNVDLQATKNPICFGETISLTTNAASNVIWSHTGSTATLVNVSPTSNTSYTVTGTAITGCTTSIALTVSVNPVPVLSAVVIPSVLCIGNAATITASGGNSYTWTASSLVAPSTTVNPGVTSNISYSGKNQFGCISNSQVAVTVNTNTLDITPNSAVCAGNSILLTANNAVTYTWSTGSNFQSTPVTPVTNTTYMASGTDIHNCVISNQVNVTVEQKPNVTASAGKNTICKGESTTLNAGGAVTYTWSGALGSGQQVTVNPPIDVMYTYTLTGTSANGCTNTVFVSVTVSKCTGLSKVDGQIFNSRIYPNPTSGEVTVELNNGLINSIEVTDLTGRVIMNVSAKEEVVSLNLTKLSNGVYYFKVKSTEHVEIIKVVKSN